MCLFGVNFNLYYLMLIKRFRLAVKSRELWCYFAIILIASGIIFFNNLPAVAPDVTTTVRNSVFQVVSVITTTGFATVDVNLWPPLSKAVLLILMFVGGCAGSTAGGIKVSRIIIFVKTVFKELLSYIHPKSIKKIQLDHKPIEHEVIRATNVYLIIFILIFAISLFFISFENKDFTTNFSAVAATLNNIGPGLSMVGPMCNFDHFSIFSKYVMIFDMLAGRLELFPLLLLFHPALWKEYFSSRKGTI
jgi:trk system potassium uptake protein TrkH